MFKLIALLIFLTISSAAHAQVLIFTYAYNRPDFIEIQYKTFKKFFLDDYDFVVFNDAKDQNLEKQINQICAQYAIRCIRIPQEIHDQPYLPRLPRESNHAPAVRNSNVVQYSLNTLGFDHHDIVMLLDSDLFLVKPFSAYEFLKGYSLGGLKQGSDPVYLWIGLVFIDMKQLPNKHTLTFNCGEINEVPVDAGGHSYYFLKNNPEANVLYIRNYYSGRLQCDPCNQAHQNGCSHNTGILKEIGFDPNQIRLLQTDNNLEFLCENIFLHYRCGSNWNNKDESYHQRKTKALNTYIAAILE